MARRQTKTFLHVIRHSLVPYDNYYADILHKTNFIFSLKYFIALSLLLIALELAGTFIGITKSYPFLQSRIGMNTILQQIPSDLVVTFQHGRLITNSDRPVIVFNPYIKNPGTLFVIDQRAEKNKVYEYEARYLFTEKELVVNNQNHLMSFDYATSTLAEGPLSIPLGKIAQESSSFISVLYSALVLILPLFITLSRLILLLLISITIYIVCYKFIPHMSFNKVLQISLHAVTAPLIMQSLASAFAIEVPLSFWWFNIMTAIFLIAALYEAYVIAAHHTRT